MSILNFYYKEKSHAPMGMQTVDVAQQFYETIMCHPYEWENPDFIQHIKEDITRNILVKANEYMSNQISDDEWGFKYVVGPVAFKLISYEEELRSREAFNIPGAPLDPILPPFGGRIIGSSIVYKLA